MLQKLPIGEFISYEKLKQNHSVKLIQKVWKKRNNKINNKLTNNNINDKVQSANDILIMNAKKLAANVELKIRSAKNEMEKQPYYHPVGKSFCI